MTKNEFKIGDVVHLKDLPQIEKEFNLPPLPDYLFRVEHIQDGKLTVVSDCSNVRFIIDAEFFELVETPDRKTAFLTELQALLRKYNATIYGGLSETHNDDVIFVSVGDDDIAYRNGCVEEYANITADNIMEFEQE